MLRTEIPIVEEVLREHAEAIGSDLAGYRNHVYRVANLAAVLGAVGEDRLQLDKIAIAAVFHDLGIWTERTFDYLGPSIARARAYLLGSGRAAVADEVEAMIAEHHQLTSSRADPAWLVEPFRRADWVDVSRGAIRFGLPAELLREIASLWPSAGFHRRLVQLSAKRLLTHPWNPLPMFRI